MRKLLEKAIETFHYVHTVLKLNLNVHCVNRSAQDHRFSLFPVICSQLPVTRTPNNSNLFLFPLKVRVIGIRL